MKKALLASAAIAALTISTTVRADVLLYGFETGDSPNSVDGFTKNGGLASNTVTQDTVGVTQGSNSALFTVTTAGFAGAITTKVDPIFSSTTTTPTAVDADITVPTGFTYTGTNAPFLGVTIFGTEPDPVAGNPPDAFQFQVAGSSERAIPFATPGVTTHVDIPLFSTDGQTYAQALADGFTPTSFQFFFDKNGPINLDIDNVVAIAPGTPEPASLSLLGLGGLVLARRRRA